MLYWEALKKQHNLLFLNLIYNYIQSLLKLGVRRAELHHSLNFLFRSYSCLMIAVSYNLWISTDHRCWFVGWGVFLMKRQMSVGGILTLWHYESWHHFKRLCLLCCPHVSERNNRCKEQHTSPQILHSDIGNYHHLAPNSLLLHLCCKAGFWGQERGKNTGLGVGNAV